MSKFFSFFNIAYFLRSFQCTYCKVPLKEFDFFFYFTMEDGDLNGCDYLTEVTSGSGVRGRLRMYSR